MYQTAIVLSDEGAKALSLESAAIDFVRDAFGHLKAIAADEGAQTLLKVANITPGYFSQVDSGGIQAICALLILVVTAVYAFYAAKQWRTMDRQLDDNEAAQSAEIVITDFTYLVSESPPKLHYKIINASQTSALNITVGGGEGAGMVKSPNEYLAYPLADSIEATAGDRIKGEPDELVSNQRKWPAMKFVPA